MKNPTFNMRLSLAELLEIDRCIRIAMEDGAYDDDADDAAVVDRLDQRIHMAIASVRAKQ